MQQQLNYDDFQKPLVCKTCVSYSHPKKQSCCCLNDFLLVCKQHYIENTNVSQLKELIKLTQGSDNFCETHGYLYEYVITFHQDNENILGCKQCIIEYFEKEKQENKSLIKKVELFNENYFNTINLDAEFNQWKLEIEQQKQTNKLQQCIKQVEERKQLIKLEETENQDVEQVEYDQQIQNIEKIQSALEQRIKYIGDKKGDFHDFLHDPYLEGLSLRKYVMGEEQNGTDEIEMLFKKGYNIQAIFKQFDDIQLSKRRQQQ